MSFLKRIQHALNKSRFKRKDLMLIHDVPAEFILSLLDRLVSQGWEVAPEFDTQASLIHRGKCIVRRGQSSLVFMLQEFRLQNDTHAPPLGSDPMPPITGKGTIEGPARIISDLAKQYDLQARSEPL